MMKKIVQVFLVLIILGLGYLIYESIMHPIRFKQERKIREKAVIERLKNIRKAEVAYNSVNKFYTGNFDTLFKFVEEGRFPLVRRIGSLEDTTLTEEDIVRDTIWIDVKDSLFTENYVLDSMKYIPYSGGKEFFLDADTIEKGRVKVSVFCASAVNKLFLKGLDRNLYEPEDSIYVGSMQEPTTEGNWE